jgi:hypothetical protein
LLPFLKAPFEQFVQKCPYKQGNISLTLYNNC